MGEVNLSQYGGNRSEVAHLLKQIEAEYNSSQSGLSGLASGTAKHEFITRKMEKIGEIHAELHALVGDESMGLLVELLSEVPLQEGTSGPV